MATLATLVVKLVTDAGEFITGIDSAAKKLDGIGTSMKNVGGDLSALSAPLLGVGAAAVVAGTQFNKGMANVVSLAPEARSQIEGMIPGVQQLAVDMGKSTSDMTAGLYQLVSATGVSGDTMANLRTNATAAAAGLATTAEAISLTSAVTKGYGDTSAAATQKAADLALKTVQLGQTTFPELAASMGRVVPLAANLGVSQEELFAAMASTVGVTGNAAEVSTQLRGVLQGLMAPTGDMADLMKSLGFANGQAMIDSLGLEGTIQKITAAADATGTPLAKYIGSIEGQTAALALAGPQADAYQQKLTAMQNAAGATDAAFAAQTQGLNASGFAMQQMGTETQVVLEKLGGALAPALLQAVTAAQPLIDTITGLIEKFTALDPSTQSTIISILGVVAVLGPLLMVGGAVVSAIGSIIGILGVLLGPVGLVIAAIALLYLAWQSNFLGIQDVVRTAWEYIQGIFAGIGDILSGNVSGGLAKIKAAFDGLGTMFKEIQANIYKKVAEIGTAIVEGIKAGIESAWSSFMDWVKAKLDGLIGSLLKLLGIKSPSTVFAAMGANMVLGLQMGMARQVRALEAETGRLAARTVAATLGGISGTQATGDVRIEQHFHGPADYAVVRQATEDAIWSAASARGYR